VNPPLARSEQTLVGAERQQLEAFLDDNRSELAAALTGLTEEQARRRLVPSLTTLLGLVKHAAWVERVWFQVSLLGHSRDELGIPQHIDDSFRLTERDSIASITADFHTACAESQRAAAGYGLDDLVLHNRRGPLTLRWVYAHMIEEHARHAGHADILREQILATGQHGN
jgi:uncharacterized damage-inducible protein DinB